jgi:hypothetical protein
MNERPNVRLYEIIKQIKILLNDQRGQSLKQTISLFFLLFFVLVLLIYFYLSSISMKEEQKQQSFLFNKLLNFTFTIISRRSIIRSTSLNKLSPIIYYENHK